MLLTNYYGKKLYITLYIYTLESTARVYTRIPVYGLRTEIIRNFFSFPLWKTFRKIVSKISSLREKIEFQKLFSIMETERKIWIISIRKTVKRNFGGHPTQYADVI